MNPLQEMKWKKLETKRHALLCPGMREKKLMNHVATETLIQSVYGRSGRKSGGSWCEAANCFQPDAVGRRNRVLLLWPAPVKTMMAENAGAAARRPVTEFVSDPDFPDRPSR